MVRPVHVDRIGLRDLLRSLHIPPWGEGVPPTSGHALPDLLGPAQARPGRPSSGAVRAGPPDQTGSGTDLGAGSTTRCGRVAGRRRKTKAVTIAPVRKIEPDHANAVV